MRFPKMPLIILGLLALGVLTFNFQNCAKAKWVDPDTRHSAFAMGLCQNCGGSAGLGVSCRTSQIAAFASCQYESCNPGYVLENNQCVPVVCQANSHATCAIDHGQGQMTCNANGLGYGDCAPIACDPGYHVAAGECIPDPVCEAGVHRDCSTESTYGDQICNESGSAYGACVFGSCKPGYYKDDGGVCQPNVCEPNTMTPCTSGAGVGFKTCNSQGSAWGVCELNGCQSGYKLIDGVCVVQVCTPNEESVCELENGSGVKICNANGTNYGPCSLVACNPGYHNINGQCLKHKCEPQSAVSCHENSGSGTRYCYQNGQEYGPCEVTSCDPGFRIKGGQCVTENSCDDGESLACSEQNGTGLRTCNSNSHQLGPCVLNACNSGYELVVQGGNPMCKKTK